MGFNWVSQFPSGIRSRRSLPLYYTPLYYTLTPSGRLVCRYLILYFSGFTFCFLFSFVFVFAFMLSLKPRHVIQSFFVMHGVTYQLFSSFFVFISFLFCFFVDVAFSSIFVLLSFSLCMESIPRSGWVFPSL